MRINHIENSAGLFTGTNYQRQSLNTREIVDLGDIMTEEPIRRFW